MRWERHPFLNCWAGHGASEVMAPGKAVQFETAVVSAAAKLGWSSKNERYIEACEGACLRHGGCEGFIFDSASQPPRCWLKGTIDRDRCAHDRALTLYKWIIRASDPHSQNVVLRDEKTIGVWGGSCTCPDGGVYDVGDIGYCDELACENGDPGVCLKRAGPWSHRGVVCDKGRQQQDEQRMDPVDRLNRRFRRGRQSKQLWTAGEQYTRI